MTLLAMTPKLVLLLLPLLLVACVVSTLQIRVRIHPSTGGVASSIVNVPCATEIVHSAERETCRYEW